MRRALARRIRRAARRQGRRQPLVELHERAGARPAPRRGRLGLYHFAILLPDRPSLGRFVAHLGEIDARAGAADHLVSEALYLQDPDNLGIEVYADRPRSTWQRIGRQLHDGADPLDVAGLVACGRRRALDGDAGRHGDGPRPSARRGPASRRRQFFSEALGFDRMVWQYPGALFLAAGGYHHHLGTNTWAGAARCRPPPEDAQLLEWTIELPDTASLDAASHSLAGAGYGAEWDGEAGIAHALVTRDDWGTPIRLQSATPPSSGA